LRYLSSLQPSCFTRERAKVQLGKQLRRTRQMRTPLNMLSRPNFVMC
jgi:hypothetical protein